MGLGDVTQTEINRRKKDLAKMIFMDIILKFASWIQ